MWGAEQIVDDHVRKGGITSQPISIEELEQLFQVIPVDADQAVYEKAVIEENVLGLATESGREYRFSALRRFYKFESDDLLFRALRDLWDADEEGRPLLAALCALANDTIFRASAELITATSPGAEVSRSEFAPYVEERFPSVYADSTMNNICKNAYTSWELAGHLGPAKSGSKVRTIANCQPNDVAYALMLGHLQGYRGHALFDTIWAQVLDHPKSELHELAFSASQRGMIEYRNAGGVIEVGFRELLRPMEGRLF